MKYNALISDNLKVKPLLLSLIVTGIIYLNLNNKGIFGENRCVLSLEEKLNAGKSECFNLK